LELGNPAEKAQRMELFFKNNFAIIKDPKFEKEFGRYPVLYVDLSVSKSTLRYETALKLRDAQNVTSSTMKAMMQDFKTCITNIVEDLENRGFFKNRLDLGVNTQRFLDNVLKKKLDDSEWPDALFDLTRVLHLLYKRKVVVLVDGYDTPTSYALQYGFFLEVRLIYELYVVLVFTTLLQAKEFFRKVFSPLLKVGVF
jgi:hypothetical protein